MKISNIKDIHKFSSMIDHLHGDVQLVAEDGSQFNLKSKLSQFVALSDYFGSGAIDEIEIRASEAADVKTIIDYLISA